MIDVRVSDDTDFEHGLFMMTILSKEGSKAIDSRTSLCNNLAKNIYVNTRGLNDVIIFFFFII